MHLAPDLSLEECTQSHSQPTQKYGLFCVYVIIFVRMLRNSRTKNVGILQCFIIVKTCVHKKKYNLCRGWSSITCEGGPAILKKLRRFSNPPLENDPPLTLHILKVPPPPASPSEYSSYKLCRSSPRSTYFIYAIAFKRLVFTIHDRHIKLL